MASSVGRAFVAPKDPKEAVQNWTKQLRAETRNIEKGIRGGFLLYSFLLLNLAVFQCVFDAIASPCETAQQRSLASCRLLAVRCVAQGRCNRTFPPSS
jgi:hypothetical protein